MTTPLLFELSLKIDKRPISALGVSFVGSVRSPRTLEPAIARYLQSHRPPEVVVAFDSASDVAMSTQALKDQSVRSRLSGLSGLPEVSTILLNSDGGLSRQWLDASRPIDPVNPAEVHQLRRQGLLHLFDEFEGMLFGSDAHHYAKPSGKHSDRFIRTGNVLRTSSASAFLAYWLANAMPDHVEAVYCDSSSIHAVAIQALVHRFGDLSVIRNIPVESFGSYEGLGKYSFERPDRSIAIISASTSGDLADRLHRERGFPKDRIITLFYLGKSVPRNSVLCDLTRRGPDLSGHVPITSYPEGECDLCQRHSLPTWIVGDQFLTEKPKLIEVTVKHTDSPEWLRGLMSEFRYSDLFRVQKFKAAEGRRLGLSVDLCGVCAGADGFKKFHEHLDRAVSTCVPASIRLIAHSDTPGAASFAGLIAARVRSQNIHADIQVCVETDLPERLSTLRAGSGVLVVAEALTDGRELVAINQLLRQRHRDTAVVYFAAFVCTEGDPEFKHLRSNLTHGDRGPGTFGFESLRTCFLPPQPADQAVVWDEEYKLLQRLGAFCEERERPFPAYLLRRKQQLEEAGGIGLADGVFLPSLTGNPLRVRDNFALFDVGEAPHSVKQATLYASIAVVLNRLRQFAEGGARLSNDQYRRTVLSPNNFTRYNDGIIQASLLRAAVPPELAFSEDLGISGRMAAVIMDALDHHDSSRGEAAPEFLVALALKRLILAPGDMHRLVSHLQKKHDAEGVFALFGDYLDESISAESPSVA